MRARHTIIHLFGMSGRTTDQPQSTEVDPRCGPCGVSVTPMDRQPSAEFPFVAHDFPPRRFARECDIRERSAASGKAVSQVALDFHERGKPCRDLVYVTVLAISAPARRGGCAGIGVCGPGPAAILVTFKLSPFLV